MEEILECRYGLKKVIKNYSIYIWMCIVYVYE